MENDKSTVNGTDRVRRSRAAKLLGVTYSGLLWLVAAEGLPQHKDEFGTFYFYEHEINAWKEKNNYTGSRFRKKKIANREREKLRRAKGIAQALAMIAEGKERLEILILTNMPSDWVDDAYAEYSLTLESAQDRRIEREKERQTLSEAKEHAAAQRSLEKAMLKDLARRRAR